MATPRRMMEHIRVVSNLLDSLLDMWINLSLYSDVSEAHAEDSVLNCCILLLNSFKGEDYMARFKNYGEFLVWLAPSTDLNERVNAKIFGLILPRVVYMLAGFRRKDVNVGLSAL